MTTTVGARAAELLRSAADGYRTGALTLTDGAFILPGDHHCRCALGAITWAADATNDDGNPWTAGAAARTAGLALGLYLVDEAGAVECIDSDGDFDWIETVGGWNDQSGRTVDEVIAALEAAAFYRPGDVA